MQSGKCRPHARRFCYREGSLPIRVDPPFELPDLSGRVAIVTGASRGIGKVVALRLAEAGCNVCCASRSEESTELLPGSIHETKVAIEKMGRRGLAVPTNVRNEDEIRSMVAITVKELGGVDIVIHNAGALFWKPVHETPVKRFDLIMDVNVRASFILCHETIPVMKERGGGSILLFSPPIEPEVMPGKTPYFLSKFGMTLLAMGLAEEVREDGIGVAALWPATLIESLATINHQLGTPAHWRKPSIVADAVLALLGRDDKDWSGHSWIDEDVLRESGITDFDRYNVVEGGTPIPIVGKDGARAWRQVSHKFRDK